MKVGPKSSLRLFLHRALQFLARKVKLPKSQEIPIISAGGKKQFCCCPWWM